MYVQFQEELGDGMIQEVQKLLWQLVCYTGNKSVVMAFIKGCLDNIEINRSDSSSILFCLLFVVLEMTGT